MREIGAGVCEIRIHGAAEHRVLYVATFPEAVYVLHAFEKKARRTPRLDVAVARTRWRVLVALRETRNE
jgi:phage-related protein